MPFFLYKVTALVAFAAGFLYFLHMFQLNTYKHKEQRQWIRKNLFSSVLPRTVFSLLSLPFLFLDTHYAYFALVGNVIYFLMNLPQKAKIPLKFTARVKRMVITSILISGILLAVISFASQSISAFMAVIPVLMLFPYLLVVLSDTINAPMEKSIRNRYIKEAKKMLASMPNLIVIGITGSYGKTSVKFFLQKLLSAKYNVLITPENYNTPMGIVKTIRENLRATHEIFLCEMGAKNKGDIKEICDIVHPKHGIITSIGPQHLESFGSIETVLSTKFELYDALPDDGLLFLNADNNYISAHPIAKKPIYYGIENGEKADFFGSDITLSEKGTAFRITEKGKNGFALSTKLIGRHNVLNLTGCAAVARTFGVSEQDILLAVKRLEAVPHRLQVIDGGDLIIIDDAYNSNPSGALAALAVLNEFEGTKILVTPGMIELGAKQEEANFRFGEEAASVCDYVLLVGKTNRRSIGDGLRSQNFGEDRLYAFDKLEEAMAKARSLPALHTAESGRKKIVLIENDLPDNY